MKSSNGLVKIFKRAEAYWSDLGPGLVTGAADDDPSGIATYSQAGARYGFGMLWLAVFTFPFMAIVQEMCARIGLVTGSGLAANIRTHYARKALYLCTTLLFTANVLNIGADLGAMAASVRLVVPSAPLIVLLIGFALISLVLQIFTTYARYSKYLKYLTLALLAYLLTVVTMRIDWGDVLFHTVVPTLHFSKEYLLLLCAVLGTTISPYLFFWQTSQEVEEKIMEGQTTIDERKAAQHGSAIRKMRVDVWSGMLFSNAAMFFIIVACGAALFGQGITNIATAADAALALRPFAGDGAFMLFMIGIVGTGLLAIPILAGSASYAISESFGWKEGLYYKLRQAYAFYGVIIVAMVIGLLINLLGISPINALLYSAVANGLIAPVMLFFIIRISSNKAIMGSHVNKPTATVLGWLILVVMALSGLAAIVSLLPGRSPTVTQPPIIVTQSPASVPKLSVAYSGLKRIRFMAWSPDHRLFLTDMKDLSDNTEGKVYILEDFDPVVKKFQTIHTYLAGLRNPNSIAFYRNWIYVALTDRLVRYPYHAGDSVPSGDAETIAIFPAYGLSYKYGGWHLTRTIAVHEDKLYVSVGSSCNVCEENPEEIRAQILIMNPDGTESKPYATGLRNAVGLTFVGSDLWATDMGVDHLGEDKPNDLLYKIKAGTNYGWPYCYQSDGEIYLDATKAWEVPFDCTRVPLAQAEFDAHSAPLGLARWGQGFLVALHGSGDARLGRGDKVVFVDGAGKVSDFVTFPGKPKRTIRPVDILINDDHSFFMTDDLGGTLYYVQKTM